MNGQALPWDWDPDLEGKLSSKPSELFPVSLTSASLLWLFVSRVLFPLELRPAFAIAFVSANASIIATVLRAIFDRSPNAVRQCHASDTV